MFSLVHFSLRKLLHLFPRHCYRNVAKVSGNGLLKILYLTGVSNSCDFSAVLFHINAYGSNTNYLLTQSNTDQKVSHFR